MRRMTIQAVMLCIAFLFLIAACEKKDELTVVDQPHPTEEKNTVDESDKKEKLKIGFSMDTLEEERWLKDKELFPKAVEALGADVEVVVANENESLQLSQVETLISEGVDLLVIVPYNTESAAAVVEKAHQAGIKVISYDRLIKNADIDLYVSFDNEMVGELQAKAITELVPKGNYVYIGGAITDNNANLLKKGVFKVLKPYIDQGDITVVYDQWTENWDPEIAYLHMKEALETNDNNIDAVIAANDGTAGGAIRALREKGLEGKIPVAGQDAELSAVQRIVQGNQTMTVYKPISQLTEAAAELAIKLANNEHIELTSKINNGKLEVPAVLLSPIEVNISNIDETIIADGFHRKEEVYQ